MRFRTVSIHSALGRGALLALFVFLPALGVSSPGRAQSLGDLVKQGLAAKDSMATANSDRVDSLAVPAAPWSVVAGEVALGSALAAAVGFGVGLLAERTFCDGCRASEPGGDTPGIAIGVPIGAVAGVWFLGRRAPPEGRLSDTALGALAGAAVFAGYSQLLENQGDGVRWSGVVLAAAVTAIGWNRSRIPAPAETASFDRGGAPAMKRRGGFDLAVLRLVF